MPRLRIPLPESTLQSKHELLQVNPMLLRKALLSQSMIRIRILAMVPGTKRDPEKSANMQSGWR
jgi:hypothetical protein